MGDTAPILSARGLDKSIGEMAKWKGVDLEVRAKGLVLVVGRSGAGKSTLLRCCSRLEEPGSGSIHVEGVDILAPA